MGVHGTRKTDINLFKRANYPTVVMQIELAPFEHVDFLSRGHLDVVQSKLGCGGVGRPSMKFHNRATIKKLPRKSAETYKSRIRI